MSVIVAQPGSQTTIQGGPRRGYRHLGVPASGAADPLSLALANKLVANSLLAPALEAVLVGPTLQFESHAAVAVTGAKVSPRVNGAEVPMHATVHLRPGDVLAIGPVELGARVYIAFAGGLRADQFLGSGSTYLPAALGGIEGRALAKKDVLQFESSHAECADLQTPEDFRPPITPHWAMRACDSADTGMLAKDQGEVLFDTNWRVGQRADRMGLELEGPSIRTQANGRLPSEPVFPGTLQCPEHGVPFLLGIDAQTTGGYARIMQVARVDRHLIGQLRAGDSLRFLPRQPAAAIVELRAKQAYWRKWLPGIETII